MKLILLFLAIFAIAVVFQITSSRADDEINVYKPLKTLYCIDATDDDYDTPCEVSPISKVADVPGKSPIGYACNNDSDCSSSICTDGGSFGGSASGNKICNTHRHSSEVEEDLPVGFVPVLNK